MRSGRYRCAIAKRIAIGIGVIGAVSLVWWLVARRQQLPAQRAADQHLSTLPAEILHLDADEIVRRGSSQVLVVRLARGVELVPHYFKSEGLPAPQPIGAWAEKLGDPILFNAGQFAEDLSHLGWLKKDGQWIVAHRHAAWQGLLLSGPTDGAAWARIADLQQVDPSIIDRYRHAIQSMMLFDDSNKIRVRDTDKAACRTVVAEDTRGRIVVILTEGAVTLADLARWLPQQHLDIVRAMNLDGGIESQLAVRTPELELSFYGQYGTGQTAFEGAPGTIHYPLPAVIAVRRVGQPRLP